MAPLELSRRTLLQGAGAVALTGVGGSLLAACGGSEGDGGTAADTTAGDGGGRAGTLTIAATTGWQGLDPMVPAVSINQSSLELLQAVYGTLTSVVIPADFEEAKAQAADGALNGRPWLAERWETARGGRLWRFTLRADAVSQWGNALSAEDVVWTFARGLSNRANVQAFLYSLGGITDPRQVTAVDEQTVELALPQAPPPYFLQMLGVIWVPIFDSVEARRHATRADPWASRWLMANSCGFGPYKLESGRLNGEARIAPNEGFWGEAPAYRELVQQAVNDAGSRLQLVLTGEAQLTQGLSAVQYAQAADAAETELVRYTSASIAFLVLDTRVAPFDDVRVRQAIARAIPYDTILRTVYRDQAQPWRSAYPPWFQGSTDDYWDYETDAAAAREVLSAVAESVTLTYIKGFGPGEQVCLLVAQALRQAGLDVRVSGLQRTVADERKLAGELAFFFDDLDAPSIPNPAYQLSYMYVTDAFQNMAHWSNAELDAIAARLARTEGIPAQNRLIARANEIIMGELPYVPVAYTGSLAATSKTVTNVVGQSSLLIDYGLLEPA